MDNNTWELLNIDDLDLLLFVRPSNQSSSSSTRLIPSPDKVFSKENCPLLKQSLFPFYTGVVSPSFGILSEFSGTQAGQKWVGSSRIH
ncbi:hypothetical protein JHK87_047507 [Glycine soja]|nr:hypothetical protein JHK87_047507 [Glycine soja]